MFDRVGTSEKKAVLVAEQILRALRAGTLTQGARLPTEREMIDQLGVSRTVLREALSALQLAGYLGSRPGYGHYVKKIPIEGGRGAIIADGLRAGLSVIEVIEARVALDLSVACLASRNATSADFAKADAIVRAMVLMLEDGEYTRYALLTLDFHEVLAASTGNAFLHRSAVSFIDEVRQSAWVVGRNYDPAKGAYSLDVHRQMLDGIRERNIEKAVDAVLAHYHDYPSLRESIGDPASTQPVAGTALPEVF